MDKKIILLGYSGHAYSIIDAVYSCNNQIIGYCEPKEQQENPFEIKYLGRETQLELDQNKANTFIFPSVGDATLRAKLIEHIEKIQGKQLSIYHQNAHISKYAQIALSVFVSNGATINALAKIGKGTIINTGAIIEHECDIQENCHVGPGATLAGNVKLGKNTFIGANASVIQGISIGSNVTIGAGAVVIHDVPDNATYVGNPARKLEK